MTDIQRAEDIRMLLDAIRDRNDEITGHYYQPLPVLKLMTWLKTLHSLTLKQYATALSQPMKMTIHGEEWGGTIDLLIEAGERKADDSFTALLLYISGMIEPNYLITQIREQTRSKANRGYETSIYEDSLVYLTGLYDTLRYNGKHFATSNALALLGENVYATTQESRHAVAALVTVTNALVVSDNSEEFILSDQSIKPEVPNSDAPLERYESLTGSGSIRLKSGELVEYVVNHPDQAPYIAEIITERKTDDVETIKMIMNQGALAVSKGVL